MTVFIIPVIFIIIFIYAAFKKVKIYDEFSKGVGEAVKFTFSLLPCLAAIFMMCAIFEASKLSSLLINWLSPVFGALGIPKELTTLFRERLACVFK